MRGIVAVTVAHYNNCVATVSICVSTDPHPYELPGYAYDLIEQSAMSYVPDEEGLFTIELRLEEIVDLGIMKAYKLTGNPNSVYAIGLGIEGIKEVALALQEFIEKSTSPLPDKPTKGFDWDEILKNDN